MTGSVAGRPPPPGATVTPSHGSAGSLLRDPAPAAFVLDAALDLSYITRTAPTLDTGLVLQPQLQLLQRKKQQQGRQGQGEAVGAQTSLGNSSVGPGEADVEQAASEAAAAAGSLVVSGADAAAAVAAAAGPRGSYGRAFESAGAAVEAAVDVAGEVAVSRVFLPSFASTICCAGCVRMRRLRAVRSHH